LDLETAKARLIVYALALFGRGFFRPLFGARFGPAPFFSHRLNVRRIFFMTRNFLSQAFVLPRGYRWPGVFTLWPTGDGLAGFLG
jgi:hypothetical protein